MSAEGVAEWERTHLPVQSPGFISWHKKERKKLVTGTAKNVSGSQGLGRREGDPGKQGGITRGAVEGFGVVP